MSNSLVIVILSWLGALVFVVFALLPEIRLIDRAIVRAIRRSQEEDSDPS